MSMTPQGSYGFSGKPFLIRKGAVLTANWALCTDHDSSGAGNISIDRADEVSFLASISFGSVPATDVRVKPVFLPLPVGGPNMLEPTYGGVSKTHHGQDVFTSDLASTAGTNVVTSVIADTFFASWMIGKYLHIASGTNFVPGSYLITDVDPGVSLTLESDPTTGGNGSVGFAAIVTEYQELSLVTASGVTTGSPHEVKIVAADLTGGAADGKDGGNVCWSQRLPALPFMRVYARCTGTATVTSLQLGVLLKGAAIGT